MTSRRGNPSLFGEPDEDVPASSGRIPKGNVRLNGNVLQDDTGDFLAATASAFAGRWLFRTDRTRLEKENLRLLVGLDGTRDFACTLWRADESRGLPDQLVDPRGSFDDLVEYLVWKFETFRLRSQLVLFAGIDFLDTREARRDYVRRILAALKPIQRVLLTIAIANEPAKNGFAGNVGREELWEYCRMVLEAFPGLPVSLGASEQYEDDEDFQAWRGDDDKKTTSMWLYDGSPANLRDDDVERSDAENGYRLIRQAFGQQPAWCNVEPPGPFSTGWDLQNVLLVLSALIETFICKGAIFCVHSSAIGTGFTRDLSRNRPYSNYSECQPLLDMVRGAIFWVRRLPQDLPNWSGTVTHSNPRNYGSFPFDNRVGTDFEIAGFPRGNPPDARPNGCLSRHYFVREGSRGLTFFVKHESLELPNNAHDAATHASPIWPMTIDMLDVWPNPGRARFPPTKLSVGESIALEPTQGCGLLEMEIG